MMKIPMYPAQPSAFLVYFNRRSDATTRTAEGMPIIWSSNIFMTSRINPWLNHGLVSRTTSAKPTIFTTTAIIQSILTGLTMLHPYAIPLPATHKYYTKANVILHNTFNQRRVRPHGDKTRLYHSSLLVIFVSHLCHSSRSNGQPTALPSQKKTVLSR